MIASEPEMLRRVQCFSNRKGWTPDQWAWLCISAEHRRFYTELQELLRSLVPAFSSELCEVLRFQSDIMLQIDYDPREGKRVRYDYDFPSYFSGDDALDHRPVRVHFRDTAMGVNRQYPLEQGNHRSFAKAAVGESYPLVRIVADEEEYYAAVR
jgi:hypothetical protein